MIKTEMNTLRKLTETTETETDCSTNNPLSGNNTARYVAAAMALLLVSTYKSRTISLK